MSQTFDGGCSCGAVRYRLASAPMITHCCHCSECQRQSGSAFAVNALIESDRVELLAGTPVGVNLPTESGDPHPAIRCGACGTMLWSHYGGRRHVSFVRVGALDGGHGIAPDVHIFTRSKAPWVVLPPVALAFEIYYDMAAVWSAEAMARRAANTLAQG